ncbi:hypothetical protein [Burkholderia ubonensis]|uniref:hypothetical protein n=1 Tax=Burkholderia ubonensis TaxID=101571 RepID=UPI000AAC092A|nr:hypothetical protein [Burkholderia ubonensis]
MPTNFSALVSAERLTRGPIEQSLHLTDAQREALSTIVLKPPQEKPEPPAPVLPDTLDFQTGPITYSNGCPVNGWAQIRLYKNGNYEFRGHFHDSGAPSYDAGIGWVIVDSGGTAFTFEAKVHLNGTFEAGPRDGNWNKSGHNDQIAANWPSLCAGTHWRWSAPVNWDWGILVKQIQDGLKTAGTVIGSVVAVVALF